MANLITSASGTFRVDLCLKEGALHPVILHKNHGSRVLVDKKDHDVEMSLKDVKKKHFADIGKC